MRINKTFSLNSRVIEEFEKQVPQQARSRTLDVLIIKFLIDGVGNQDD